MKILYSPEFLRRYERLSDDIKEKTEQCEEMFRENPFDRRLKTHKLQGKWIGFWAFSIDFKYRIIFKFQYDKSIRFYAIGSHSIYK